MQVQVRDVAAELARLRQTDQGVQVRPVHIDLAARGVHRVADLGHVRVIHAVGGGVGDHDRREGVLVRLDLRVQIRVVNRAVRRGRDDHDLHAGQDRRRGVGAVRGGRDQADVPLRVAVGQVVAADREQARELTLGPGVRLQRDLVIAGDLGQVVSPGR